ncbi:uncharacterized protein LOC121423826 [Lytechinus variegatus]|uniref:uncharacterized protein LOC121423826 n=1 Tax=Lytechinus variegatus TaxID=7654 RepID=UPI001BB1A00D|nr:uncharacterized protein LOC121423826 [Lytechinus variegatus]
MSTNRDSRKHPLSPEKTPQSSKIARKKPNQSTPSTSPGDQGTVEMDSPLSAKPGTQESMKRSLFTSDLAPGPGQSPPQWFVDFFKGFEARLENYIENITLAKFSELSSTLDQQNEKLSACSMQIEDLEKQVKKLKLDNTQLVNKIDDLENRGRRNNLIFHGIPEQAHGPGSREDVAVTLQKVLQDFVGLSASEYKIERCHRTPTGPPIQPRDQAGDQDLKPRIIHACFSSFADKEQVRKACIQKFKVKDAKFHGRKLFVAEDFSKRVMMQRKEKMDELKKLKENGQFIFLFLVSCHAKVLYHLVWHSFTSIVGLFILVCLA